jgi:hypothetical protein
MGYLVLGICLIFISPVFAQVDASALRAKFGAPLSRETFTVRAGIEMIVDYSPTRNLVCRLELPGHAPVPRDVPAGVGTNTKKLIDEIVEEIVPPSVRGKELGRMCESTGISGICSKEYEYVSISEPSNGARRTAVIVRFKTADCNAADR